MRHHTVDHGTSPSTHADLPNDQHAHASDAPADVLVIDDDPAIVELFTSLLVCEEDLTVHGAYSAADVMAWSPPVPPAVVFLDLTVPGDRAVETIRALRSRPGWARVPVVICSGVEKPAIQARPLGAVEYLAKPFDLDAVAALARGYVAAARTR
jgi:DNA-binding NtrC family response regulator